MIRIIAHKAGLSYAEVGPILINIGLAVFRNREEGDLKDAIEEAVWVDYLKRRTGIRGLTGKPDAIQS